MNEKLIFLLLKPYLQTILTCVSVLFAPEIKARKEMKKLMDCSFLELLEEKGEGSNQLL